MRRGRQRLISARNNALCGCWIVLVSHYSEDISSFFILDPISGRGGIDGWNLFLMSAYMLG